MMRIIVRQAAGSILDRARAGLSWQSWMESRMKGGRLVVLGIVLILPLLIGACSRTGEEEAFECRVENSKDPIALVGNYSNINETARFLAARPLATNSSLHVWTKRSNYKRYAGEVRKNWEAFQQSNLASIQRWSSNEIPEQLPTTVFYPFSGPDLLHALAMYPQARDIILFGLEDIGRMPRPQAFIEEAPRRIVGDLRGLPHALEFLFYHSFFVTADMAKQIGQTSYSGVSGVLLFLLSRGGFEVLDARLRLLLPDGSITNRAAGSRVPVARTNALVPLVELVFHRPGEKKLIRARYYQLDIQDTSPQLDTFLTVLKKTPPASTLIKSASYLMHNAEYFGRIRRAILENSVAIIQDDSGIPFHSFKTNEWALRLYGRYHKPLPVFKEHYQPDLQAAVAENSRGKLPFVYGYGYGYRDMTYHLTLALRRRFLQALTAGERPDAKDRDRDE